MSLPNLTSNASPDDNPQRPRSHGRAPKLTALTLVVLGGVLLLGVVTALAKEKKPEVKTVKGLVSDDAENPIVGATVELSDLQTKKVLDIYSQEGGQYQFGDLRTDHDYTVKATYKGSSSEERRVSMFDTRLHLVLNLAILKPKN